jgi:3-oxoacyl-(acyl-carrier-protein) synthase III
MLQERNTVTAGIIAIGAHVPPVVVSNAQVAQWANVTEDWIISKTNIRTRRYARPDDTTSTIARAAVDDLLEHSPDALDGVAMIILATSTPDRPMPATAAALQRMLGLHGVPFHDIDAVCGGWLYALRSAQGLVATMKPHERVLVVAADVYSRILDRTDRGSVPIFGDGAAAVVVGRVAEPYGVRSLILTGHGELEDLVTIRAGGSARPITADRIAAGEHLFAMNGRPVADYVIRTLPPLIDQACREAGVARDAITSWVFHQANPRLLETLAERMDIDPKTVILTGPDWGNSGAASLPTALAVAYRTGELPDGELAVVAGVHGGMGAGAGVLRRGTGLNGVPA